MRTKKMGAAFAAPFRKREGSPYAHIKMGAYAAPCMEENNEKMAALLVSIAYSGSRVDPAIIVSSKCTSVKTSQKIAMLVLPCFRLANALYALLRAVFSCSARAAALRITCLVRPAQGHDRKKVSASSAAPLGLQ